jgi:creatinine amidohydrolase
MCSSKLKGSVFMSKPVVRFGELTYLEIRSCIQKGYIALIPTGCTEQQGPHLPVDFDTWFAETVLIAAAEQLYGREGINALVLPALPFGPTPEHRNYGSGYIDLPVNLHDAVIASVLLSLAQQGFRRLIVWRGCGGHDLSGVVETFNKTYVGSSQAFLPVQPYHDIWQHVGDPSVSGGHADSFTTSIALYLRPDVVRKEFIVHPHAQEVDWSAPDLDFTRYSSMGVIGDPTHASAELGAQLWAATVSATVDILKEVVSTH